MLLKLFSVTALAAAFLLAGCGPNDRLRDTYMGQHKSDDYKPVKRDANGNPILK